MAQACRRRSRTAKPHSGRGGRRTPRLSEAGSAAGQAEDSEDALALARSLFDVKARTRFPAHEWACQARAVPVAGECSIIHGQCKGARM